MLDQDVQGDQTKEPVKGLFSNRPRQNARELTFTNSRNLRSRKMLPQLAPERAHISAISSSVI